MKSICYGSYRLCRFSDRSGVDRMRVIRCSAWLARMRLPLPLPPQEPMYIAVRSKISRACAAERPLPMA